MRPRLPRTIRSKFPLFLISALHAGYLTTSADALAQTITNDDTQTSGRPQLKLERQLDENRAPVRDRAPTFARAQNIDGTIDEKLILRGDAEIRRGGTVLRGDTITYTQATDIVNVEGQARVFRDGAAFAGPRLDFRVDAQTGTMPDANFTYAPRRGRGEAELVEFLGSDRARMERARFTTCGPGDNAWWVQAEAIEFDGLDETATATFATLYFKGLPVLASPILSFPTSDRRKSGFLTPSFGLSSTLGTDISTPYYFNLAPNYDYTLTPRVMTKRGVLFENELRYLSPTQRATLLYHGIAKDREFGYVQGLRSGSVRIRSTVGPCGRHQLQPRFGRSILCRFRNDDCRHISKGPAAGRLSRLQPGVLEYRRPRNEEPSAAGSRSVAAGCEAVRACAAGDFEWLHCRLARFRSGARRSKERASNTRHWKRAIAT